MTNEADDALVERVVSAHRDRSPLGEIRPSAAFFDLEPDDRERAFDRAVRARQLEAALDPNGRSTTVAAVLARITGAKGR